LSARNCLREVVGAFLSESIYPRVFVRALLSCAHMSGHPSHRQMARSPPNLQTIVIRSACIQGVLKVKVKGHVIRALFWILGMNYSVIDSLVLLMFVQLTTANSELEKQVVTMKETQQEFIAEVCIDLLTLIVSVSAASHFLSSLNVQLRLVTC